MASKRLLLYATDAYKLSSHLLRRVLLAKPATLEAYRERWRQLLLDQSRNPASPNVAAVKLLEWDREWNLIQYHGVEGYARRWWADRSWSPFLSISSNRSAAGGGGGGGNAHQPESLLNQSETADKGNVARVAFMITSNQRRELSTRLGYESQDIRSFKPIEALLLLEHGVKREGDFRSRLRQLVEENERLAKNQQKSQPRRSNNIVGGDFANHSGRYKDGSRTATPIQQSVSPEEAEQLHVKTDVAVALLSVDKHSDNQRNEAINADEERGGSLVSSPKSLGVDTKATVSSLEIFGERTISVADDPCSPATPSATAVTNNVTPRESEELRMKPDVAAAMLASQHQNEQGGEQGSSADGGDEANEGGPCWFEVVEMLPGKQTTSSAAGLVTANPSPGGSDATDEERVIALFPTRREALECVRIKRSFRSRFRDGEEEDGEGCAGDGYLVRRRQNV